MSPNKVETPDTRSLGDVVPICAFIPINFDCYDRLLRTIVAHGFAHKEVDGMIEVYDVPRFIQGAYQQVAYGAPSLR